MREARGGRIDGDDALRASETTMPELTQCPQCQRKLNVQEAQLGQTVQCPVCGEFFTATVITVQRPSARPPAPPEERQPPRYDAPPPRGRDYDDHRPRPRDDYDDDHDRGPRPPRRGSGSYRDPYGYGRPHRGGAVLALGLIGMLLSCIPLAGWVMGGIAVGMANTDLQEMSRGTMDDSGRGLTQGGQVCGTIALVISTLSFLSFCLFNLNNM